jgi:hypothetical protein
MSAQTINPLAVRARAQGLAAADENDLKAIKKCWRELQDALAPPPVDPGRTGRSVVAADISSEARKRLVDLLAFLTRWGPTGFFFPVYRLQGMKLLQECVCALESAWHGDDWDALQPQSKRLLEYMHGKERAALYGLCEFVWMKDFAAVGDNALNTALSRANAFLEARGAKRMLHKVRREPFVAWQ